MLERLISMKSVEMAWIVAEAKPVVDVTPHFIRIIYFINIVLDKRFSQRGATAVPDYAFLVNPWNK